MNVHPCMDFVPLCPRALLGRDMVLVLQPGARSYGGHATTPSSCCSGCMHTMRFPGVMSLVRPISECVDQHIAGSKQNELAIS